MKEKVLEIEIKKINQEYSVWWITYQNEWVFPRGEFKDDELGVYSFMQHSIFEDEKEGWILNIKGKATHYDITPRILENKYLPILIKKVDEINEKYGIEKFEIERCMKDEMYYNIDTIFSVSWDIEGSKLINELRYDTLNYFKSKREAEWCAKHMKDYLLKLRKEWRKENEKI